MRILWLRRGLAVTIGMLLAVQGIIITVHTRDQPRPVSVDAAVDRFRTSAPRTPTSAPPASAPTTTPAAAAPDPTLQGTEGAEPLTAAVAPAPAGQTPESAPAEPTATTPASGDAAPPPAPHPPPGVYTYRTDGYEHVDALGGRRHDYPDETTITYTPDSCGVRALWAPLEDRYDERLLCAGPGGTEMRWFESSHAFFGQSDTRRLICDPPSIVYPVPATPGQEWRFRCTDERTEAISRSRVVGVEPFTVGEETRNAVHVAVTSTVTGDSDAESELDIWVDEETGLVLRQIFALDGTSPGPSGDVAYTERYELVLRSIEPRT